jgi:hypothetical protein
MAAAWLGRYPNAAGRLMQRKATNGFASTDLSPTRILPGLWAGCCLRNTLSTLWVPSGETATRIKNYQMPSQVLVVADELKCKSISMPAISTGIFGFPKDRAAKIIFSAIEAYFSETKESIFKMFA